MAKLARKQLILFGNAGATSNFGEFGSKAAGSPNTSKDPAIIQALAAWSNGWQDAVVTGNKAAYLEDMNGWCYVLSYMAAYMFQEGNPEWQSATTYYIGSIAKKTGTFELYGSLIDNNTGNALPSQVDSAQWKYLTPATILDGGVTVNAIPKVSAASPGKVVNSALTDDGVTVATSLPIKFPDNTTQATAAAPVTNQNVVTGSRALNTVFHNISGKPMFVSVSVGLNGASASALTDASVTPTTTVVVMSSSSAAPDTLCLFFIVLPGNYYKIAATGISFSLDYWTEWT